MKTTRSVATDIIILAGSVLLLSAPFFSVFAQESGLKRVEISPTESSVSWIGRKVTGSHSGTIPVSSGEVSLVGESIRSGTFGLDLAGVKVTDIPDPSYNAKLVKHLKSPDFFSSENFPSAKFTIESATKLDQPLATGENTQIKGALTIKGITKMVEFPAEVVIRDGIAEARGSAKIDRTQWDIRYGSGRFFKSLGDKLIFDEVEVKVALRGRVVG
jgi:polyisoprenoid-binding protein YceI